MRRPLKSRIWFYRPGSWSPGLRFIRRGGDEFDWHTIVVGSRLTGAVIFATRPCPRSGPCSDLDAYEAPVWPVDYHGHKHIGPCSCETCLDDPNWNC